MYSTSCGEGSVSGRKIRKPFESLFVSGRLVQLDEWPRPTVLPRNGFARESQHLVPLPHTHQVRKPLRDLFDLICTFWGHPRSESFDSYVDPHPDQEVSLGYWAVGKDWWLLFVRRRSVKGNKGVRT